MKKIIKPFAFASMTLLFLTMGLRLFAQDAAQSPNQAIAPAAEASTDKKIEKNLEKTEAIAPTINNSDGYFYDPTGRRDPFMPASSVLPEPLPMPDEQAQAVKPVENTIFTNNPLLNFELEKYKLVAILWQVRDPKVVIKDPNGKTHLMRKDNKIGKNNGFIAEIREGEVVIVEPVTQDGVNTATTKILSLKR